MREKNIDEFIESLIEETRDSAKAFGWNKNEIMRYVYVTLGKELNKSTDFFYSREGKYKDKGLSIAEMEAIHEKDAAYEVTCKVTAKMLSRIYKALGIKTEMKQSVYPQTYEKDGVIYPVHHTYLLAEGEGGKQYFLSLNNDLVNIKTNSRTECFGAKIEYVFNGKQNYEGEEVHFSTFTDKELYDIDNKIGYTIPLVAAGGKVVFVYTPDLSKQDVFGKQRKNTEDFLDIKLPELDKDFLAKFYACCRQIGKETFTEYTDGEVNRLKWLTIYETYNLILRKMGVDTSKPDERLNEIISKVYTDEDTFDIDKLFAEVMKIIKENPNRNGDNQPFVILRTATNFIRSIDRMRELAKDPDASNEEKIANRELYLSTKKSLSKFFLPEDVLKEYSGDKNPSSRFVYDKLKTMFEMDFECDTTRDVPSYRPQILQTKMKLVEQSVFFKRYLLALFRGEFPTEKDFYERIIFSSMTAKENKDEYAFLIHIKSKDDSGLTYTLLYDPQKNELKTVDYLFVKMKYNVHSKTMEDYFENKKKQPGEE